MTPSKPRVDDAFLARCPRLRVVSATLKGCDNFDAGACTRRGIWLTVLPDPIIAPTAELAIGLAIGLMRKIAAGDARIRRDDFAGWRPQLYGAGLSGSTVGIAGMGQPGQAIARRLAGFESLPTTTNAGSTHGPRRHCRSPATAWNR